MVDRNLEGKLIAIQDLKKEKYIGTQTAWTYLNRVASLYENPERVSKIINARIAEKGAVNYPATPEIIVGLGFYFPRILVKAYVDNVDEADLDNEPEEADFSDDRLGDSPIFSSVEIITDKKDYRSTANFLLSKSNDGTLSGLINYLTPLFLENQSEGITNADFATQAIQYPSEIDEIPENIRIGMYEKVASSDWDQLLSLDSLRTLESKIKRGIFTDEIKVDSRIKLIINDQADHKLEYRREILTDFIDSMLDDTFIGESEQVDYDTLRKMNLKHLTNARKRLKSYQDSGAPDSLGDNERRMIQKKEFLLRVMAPERNFINRYLRS